MKPGFQINIRFKDSADLTFLRQFAEKDQRTLTGLIKMILSDWIKANRK